MGAYTFHSSVRFPFYCCHPHNNISSCSSRCVPDISLYTLDATLWPWVTDVIYACEECERREKNGVNTEKKTMPAGRESNQGPSFSKLYFRSPKFVKSVAGRSRVHLLPQARGRIYMLRSRSMFVRWSCGVVRFLSSEVESNLCVAVAVTASGGQPNRAPARSTGSVDRELRHCGV